MAWSEFVYVILCEWFFLVACVAFESVHECDVKEEHRLVEWKYP